MGWVNLQASMQQFSHTIASQTRLDIEGNHLDIFNANFRHDVSLFARSLPSLCLLCLLCPFCRPCDHAGEACMWRAARQEKGTRASVCTDVHTRCTRAACVECSGGGAGSRRRCSRPRACW
jgi:hypothetical protein